LGHVRAILRSSWGLGASRGHIEAILELIGRMFKPCCGNWGYIGAILGLAWGHFEASLGPCWGQVGAMLGPSWDHVGLSWGHLGLSESNLEDSFACLDHLGAILGPI
jgi:hypothetical protein